MTAKNRTKNLVYMAISIAVMTVMSQISIPIGPIPLSLGILGVFLTSGLLGWFYGELAVMIYVGMGALGAPVFAGFKGGLGVLLGATGGFIIAYLFIPIIIGLICKFARFNFVFLTVSMLLSLLVTYTIGTLWFMNYLAKDVKTALYACVIPFIVPDLFKIILADFLIIKLRKILIRE